RQRAIFGANSAMNSPATALFITANSHERTERMPACLPLPAADSTPASSSVTSCICCAESEGAEAAGYVGDDAQVGQKRRVRQVQGRGSLSRFRRVIHSPCL